MADIPNRAELEAELTRRFSRVSAKHRKLLIAQLGNPPNIGNLTPAFWEGVAVELNATLIPFLSEVYLDAAERMVAGLPIGVDWALVNERAAAWARGYSFELVRKINEGSRRATQEAVAGFFEQGQTRGDLEKQLARIYGTARAEAIGVTEVTRAASEGEQGIARELSLQGIDMVPIWRTNEDELVCTICGDPNRANKPIDDNFYPPAHPRCRCFLSYELPKVKRRG